jgi:hypothetical protein
LFGIYACHSQPRNSELQFTTHKMEYTTTSDMLASGPLAWYITIANWRIVQDKSYRESVENTLFICTLCLAALFVFPRAVVQQHLGNLLRAPWKLFVLAREGLRVEIRARGLDPEGISRGARAKLRRFVVLTVCLVSIRLAILVVWIYFTYGPYLSTQPVPPERIERFILPTRNLQPRVRITLDGDRVWF